MCLITISYRTLADTLAAENYYTADYPDEDLDWDDQFDRNNYRYAKEWGAEDVEDLDDDQWDRISDDVKKTGY